MSTATFGLTYLRLSTKLWCKPYFSDDKSKEADDKFKAGMLYLSLVSLLNLIFKLNSLLFSQITLFGVFLP